MISGLYGAEMQMNSHNSVFLSCFVNRWRTKQCMNNETRWIVRDEITTITTEQQLIFGMRVW